MKEKEWGDLKADQKRDRVFIPPFPQGSIKLKGEDEDAGKE